MRRCAECSEYPQAWVDVTAPPGRCSECGQPFDLQGRPIPDEGVICPVHDPILAGCPHSEADAETVPVPPASWLDDGTSQGVSGPG